MRVNVASMMLMANTNSRDIRSGGGSIINLSSVAACQAPSEPALSDVEGRYRELTARDGGASRPATASVSSAIAPGTVYTPMWHRAA